MTLCDASVRGLLQVVATAGKREGMLPAAFSVDMWSLGMLAFEVFVG